MNGLWFSPCLVQDLFCWSLETVVNHWVRHCNTMKIKSCCLILRMSWFLWHLFCSKLITNQNIQPGKIDNQLFYAGPSQNLDWEFWNGLLDVFSVLSLTVTALCVTKHSTREALINVSISCLLISHFSVVIMCQNHVYLYIGLVVFIETWFSLRLRSHIFCTQLLPCVNFLLLEVK